MTIRLPKEFAGKEYEEPVVAFIKSFGYFVETRIILDHQGKQLLELDVVATPSSEDYLKQVLIEAKSGKETGFSVLFKVYGWRKFLGIPRGCIIVKREPDKKDIEAIANYIDELNVSWEVFNISKGDFTADIEKTIPRIILCSDDLQIHHFVVSLWASIAERICESAFSSFKKTFEDAELVEKIKTYEHACELSFFEKNPLKRIITLLDAFKTNPYVSGACIDHFATKNGKSTRDIQDIVFNTSDYLWLQYIMLIEHRARYLIIKCAVDYCLTPETNAKWNSLHRSLLLSSVSPSIRTGIKFIEQSPIKEKIPYIIQTFIESLGGIYFTNSEKDKELIENLFQVKFEQFTECLKVFDIFFPTTNSWFMESKGMISLKFLPAVIRGVGCFLRDKYICKSYNELCPSKDWLLGKYHNVLFHTLTKDERLVEKDN